MAPVVKTEAYFGDDIFLPAPRAAFRRIGEEVVIVDTANNTMMTLNSTGSEIWSQLTGRSLDDIARHVVERFEVSADDARAHLIAFVSELHARGLVDKTGAAAE